MPSPTRPLRSPTVHRRLVAPGVSLHLLPTPRFATTMVRVVFHRRLAEGATATSLLAEVMQSATAEHRTRTALAHALADLYGAGLHLGVAKVGDRQLLTASLEWPTAHVPRASRQLRLGLELLRTVLTRPLADAGGLDAETVETERTNLRRALLALGDDKPRYARTRAVALTCAGEPHALGARGAIEELPSITRADLALRHAALLREAPVDVFVLGDLRLGDARRAVADHLLWPGRAARARAVPRAAAPRAARPRPQRVVETQPLTQAQVVLTWRAAIRAGSRTAAAAATFAGLLGGGSFSKLFQVARETHGLCYFADASYDVAKGYLLVHAGTDPKDELRLARLARRLTRELAEGRVDGRAHGAYLETVASRLRALGDDQGSLLGWHQGRACLDLTPDPAAWLARLRAVTPAALRDVGRRLRADTTFVLRPGRGGRS